jgi:hypothetical protein
VSWLAVYTTFAPSGVSAIPATENCGDGDCAPSRTGAELPSIGARRSSKPSPGIAARKTTQVESGASWKFEPTEAAPTGTSDTGARLPSVGTARSRALASSQNTTHWLSPLIAKRNSSKSPKGPIAASWSGGAEPSIGARKSAGVWVR